MSIYCILLFNCLYIYNILNFCLYNVIYMGQGLRVGRWMNGKLVMVIRVHCMKFSYKY